MQRLEVSGAVRPIYVSLGVKRLKNMEIFSQSRSETGATKLLTKTSYKRKHYTAFRSKVSPHFVHKIFRKLLSAEVTTVFHLS